MKTPITKITALVVMLVAGASVTAPAVESELDQLRTTVKAMQETINSLTTNLASVNARLAEVEKTNAAVASANLGTNYVTFGGLLKVQVPEVSSNALPTGASPVGDYRTFNDLQSAAARLFNRLLEPTPEGFTPLFGTKTLFKLGGYARLDAIVDSENMGNPNEFIPSSIPVDGQAGEDGGERFTMHAKASRISLELRRPVPGNDEHLRIYYENDFFNNASASSMDYRLRHFYGQAYNFLIGQTFTTFMDVDAQPDVLDFEGPNGLVNRRQPQVRYTIPFCNEKMSIAFALEQPNFDLTGTGIPANASGVNRAPDGVVAWRWEEKPGHLQVAGIVRSIGYEQDHGSDEDILGWGVSASGALKVFKDDKIYGQVAYGHGIGRYINDTGGLGLDAALDSGGDLKAIPMLGLSTGYSHQWTERWRSTASYGYVWADPESSLGDLALESTHYASLNLVWQPTKAFRMGIEGLYGKHTTQGGAEGDGFRANFVIKYDLVK